jgi:hypothetical protein
MPEGQCRLCGVESTLQLSHILPAFVIRWLRESSGTGKIRLGTSPNRRVQGGLKRHWLCTSCENRLSRSETSFAEKLFYPYINRKSSKFIYCEWLLHFCVSISWRVLQHYKDNGSLKNYEPDAMAFIAQAERTWKAFLRGQLPHPGRFSQHFFPLDGIDAIQYESENLSPNINRYLMRTIDTDIVRGKGANFVYSKLGRFLILGFIREDRPSRWQGAKVHVKTGRIEHCGYTIPKEFFEYVNTKARREAELISGLSPRQADKIDQAYRENINTFVGSDAFIAMQHDIRMFGGAAFIPKRSAEGAGR